MNDNSNETKLNFESFLTALSGQKATGLPPKPPLKSVKSPESSKPRRPRQLKRKDSERQDGIAYRQDVPYQKRSIPTRRPVSPPVGPVSREAKRTVPTEVDEESIYLMGTRQKAIEAPMPSEVEFPPVSEDVMAPIEEEFHEPEDLPIEESLPGGYEEVVEYKAPETGELEDKKEAKTEEPITLSHVSLRPQFTLEQLFETIIRENASDLHIATSSVPALRINGEIVAMDLPELDSEFAENLLLPILSEENRAIFEETGEVDFSFDYFDRARFRVNYYKHYRGIGGVFRKILFDIPTLDQLGLPPVLKNLLKFRKGLILVAGPGGSGKSTTIASMLNEINHTRKLRIITLENPVEYMLKNDLSLVSQREIGPNANNYTEALWAVLREDPDVIMVSELWEPEDIRQVLTISETGHLVIASINTVDCTKAIEKMVNSFAVEEHDQIRISLSESLIGVVSQLLLPRADGRGQVLANEILLATTGLSTVIREGKFFQIHSIIQTGGDLGMQTMDQSLIELMEKKLIAQKVAKIHATDDRLFRRAGIRFDD